MLPARSSRQRYQTFRQLLRQHHPDELPSPEPDRAPPKRADKAERRRYLRDYISRLWPFRRAIAGLFVLALLAAGLDMIHPLFMRYVIDQVLLVDGLDQARPS
jgi:ATP-binding cassette subfamily B protein/subfamily B ATP-binding cassette protein MsbA